MLARKILNHLRAASTLLSGPVGCPRPVESDDPPPPPATVDVSRPKSDDHILSSSNTTEIPDRSSVQSSNSLMQLLQLEADHLRAELRLVEKLHGQLDKQRSHLERSARQIKSSSRQLEAQRRVLVVENEGLAYSIEAIENGINKVTGSFNKLEDVAIYQALNSSNTAVRIQAAQVCSALRAPSKHPSS